MGSRRSDEAGRTWWRRTEAGGGVEGVGNPPVLVDVTGREYPCKSFRVVIQNIELFPEVLTR